MNTVTYILTNHPRTGNAPGVFDFASSYGEDFARHIPGEGFLDVGHGYTARKSIALTAYHEVRAMLEKQHDGPFARAGSAPVYIGIQERLTQSSSVYVFMGGNIQGLYSSIQDIPAILSPIDLSSFEGVIATLQSKGFSKSANRLVELQFADDLEEGDKPLSLESARGFVKLMCNFQKLGEPGLGLFPRGTLAVDWRIADDKHLLVQPLDSEYATFAFIGPADSESGSRYRLNGRGTIAKVIDTLQKEGVEQWAA